MACLPRHDGDRDMGEGYSVESTGDGRRNVKAAGN